METVPSLADSDRETTKEAHHTRSRFLPQQGENNKPASTKTALLMNLQTSAALLMRDLKTCLNIERKIYLTACYGQDAT